VAGDETQAYRTERAVFDSIQVGDPVQFDPTSAEVPRFEPLE
jgi:hypothetical protein